MAFEEISLGKGIGIRTVRALSGKETVPQVFIDGDYIGGSEALIAHLEAAEKKAA
jgi:glutaredoxin-related protein